MDHLAVSKTDWSKDNIIPFGYISKQILMVHALSNSQFHSHTCNTNELDIADEIVVRLIIAWCLCDALIIANKLSIILTQYTSNTDIVE